MITIYKYVLTTTNYQEIAITGYRQTLSVKEQRAGLVLYALVDTEIFSTSILVVKVQGTSNDADVEGYRFVDTVIMSNGVRVWHVFIRKLK